MLYLVTGACFDLYFMFSVIPLFSKATKACVGKKGITQEQKYLLKTTRIPRPFL